MRPIQHEADAIADYFNESARFTRFANYLGVPAISIPCGFDAQGLPLGVQLIGPPFSEKRLLETAHRFQQATDYHQSTPKLAQHSRA